ncbi:hypothetical protein Tco_0039743 [Tanacetum coccineum]
MLQRFENRQDDYSALAETHEECLETVRKLVTTSLEKERNELSVINKNQANWIRELEAELEKNNFELEIVEEESIERDKERQDLLSLLYTSVCHALLMP